MQSKDNFDSKPMHKHDQKKLVKGCRPPLINLSLIQAIIKDCFMKA